MAHDEFGVGIHANVKSGECVSAGLDERLDLGPSCGAIDVYQPGQRVSWGTWRIQNLGNVGKGGGAPIYPSQAYFGGCVTQ